MVELLLAECDFSVHDDPRWCDTHEARWPDPTKPCEAAVRTPETLDGERLLALPKLNAPDATGQWHQWVKVADIEALAVSPEPDWLTVHPGNEPTLCPHPRETHTPEGCSRCGCLFTPTWDAERKTYVRSRLATPSPTPPEGDPK